MWLKPGSTINALADEAIKNFKETIMDFTSKIDGTELLTSESRQTHLQIKKSSIFAKLGLWTEMSTSHAHPVQDNVVSNTSPSSYLI